jgi:hypothetical protein
MERLLRVWEANPHLRLGQLLRHATYGVDISYLFDEELAELLEQHLPKKPTLVPRRDAAP